MKKLLQFSSLVIVLILIFSFIPRGPKKMKLPKGFSEKFSHIPSGELQMENMESQVDEFYMSKYEISNLEYMDFLNEMRLKGNQDILGKVEIKGELWQTDSFSEAYSVHYHTHPAYEGYPVVNITHEAATLWCEWATEKANQEWGDLYEFEYRLPSRNEWLHAANDGHTRMKYSWGGPLLENAQGCKLCNFKNLGAENIHYDDQSGEYKIIPEHPGWSFINNNQFDISAPVKSYISTSYGLHNLNGNVSEMVSEQGLAVGGSWNSTGYDVRNESVETFDFAKPTIGFRPVAIVRKK